METELHQGIVGSSMDGEGGVMSQWRLGLKLLRREGFSGELRWFVLALALSVACVLSVALVADRLDAGLKASGRDFIGGTGCCAPRRRHRQSGWRRRIRRAGRADHGQLQQHAVSR